MTEQEDAVATVRFHDRSLYGDEMAELRNTINENTSVTMRHDPVKRKATLHWENEDD